ncbi:putative cyclin-D7-1 [Zingiber officinale]|uniref:putative cyclin-D7-1 n=1 Tax=Zingiber officinale TaxID=94328 RepID=UPI001C4D21AF|nr:putative cyclin-D7-1 [Zingiber officinale]
MENSSICLLCDEEPFLGSPIPSPRHFGPQISSSSALSRSSQPVADDGVELENFLFDLLQREHIYLPSRGYHERLHQTSHLPLARARAIQYIISVCSRLNLGTGTTFNAVNYLDRFISINSTVKWEDWMMELLSIACLSIASKMDEVSVPSLLDLQMEDLDHSFESITIQQMELTVLRKLDWRLSSITPYSYVEALTWGSDRVRTRVVELLVGALSDSRFLQFNASNVAASALKAVGEGEGGSPFAPFVRAHGTIGIGFDIAPMWVPFGINQRGKKRKRDGEA